MGSGHVASQLAQAWAAVRPIASVAVWNVRAAGAERLAAALRDAGFDARATTDLASAARDADIVSCATLATEPLIRGAWLRPGAHLDLIGGYLPTMREADDDAVRGAAVFIDTDAALAEAGDIIAAARLRRAGGGGGHAGRAVPRRGRGPPFRRPAHGVQVGGQRAGGSGGGCADPGARLRQRGPAPHP